MNRGKFLEIIFFAACRNFTDVRNKFLEFKNNVPFNNCISKINNVLIDDAENSDIVMPMYNLLGYTKNYRKTTGSLWNHYRDEPNNPPFNPHVGNNPPTVNYNADPITNSASFKYKISILWKTPNANQENSEKTEQENTRTKKILQIVVPLKHLSNFSRTLNMPFINCEVSLTLTWSEKCGLADIITQATDPNADPVILAINAPTNATF